MGQPKTSGDVQGKTDDTKSAAAAEGHACGADITLAFDIQHLRPDRDGIRHGASSLGTHADLLRCGEALSPCSEVRVLRKMGIPDLDEPSLSAAFHNDIQSPLALRPLEGVAQHATKAPI